MLTRKVTVRATVGARERQRWDELMGAHHYLPFRTLVGRSMRHVAVLGERWLALVGWQAGAFKLRPTTQTRPAIQEMAVTLSLSRNICRKKVAAS